MRPRTLLILSVLVLALGAFVWFYERKLPSSEERAEQEKKVLTFEKDDVSAISLQSDSGSVRLEKIVLPAPKPAKTAEKTEEPDELSLQPPVEWRIVQPLQARADTFAVDGLLDALAALEKTGTLDDVKPAEVGLDRPRATVRLKTAKGETVLKIGAEVPASTTTLAAVEGHGGAYVVGDSILSEIQRLPGDWRDKQMFHGDRDKVRRITLVSEGSRVVLVSSGDGDSLRIESPFRDRADRDKMDDLFAELSGLTAERFVEVAPQPPITMIEVAFENGPPQRIELGAAVASAEPVTSPDAPPPTPTLGGRAGGQLFEVRTRLNEVIARPAAEWRAQTLSGLQAHEVESAAVQDTKGKLDLTRAEPDWKRGSETISYLPVSDFLFALLGARADRLLTAGEAATLGISLGRPALFVVLKTKGRGEETLQLYPPVAAGVPARSSGRDVILLLPSGLLGEVQGKLAEVRAAKPVDAKK